MHPREGEQPVDTRGRMQKIVNTVKTINQAKIQEHNIEEGKTMWSSYSKSPQERQRAAHASKVRKLFHVLAPALVPQLETEYATGSVWLGNTMLASSTRPKGKVTPSWVVISLVAAKIKTPVHDRVTELAEFHAWAKHFRYNVEYCWVSIQKIQIYLAEQGLESEIWLLQEVARKESGWSKPVACGRLTLQKYQGLDAWRGVAIAYDSRKFIARKRKACEQGIWILLEIAGTTKQFWVGSGYLSTGVSQDIYELQRALLKALPPASEPIILAGDWNVPFGCRQDSESTSVSTGSGVKLRNLKAALMQRRLHLIPQEDANLFMHHSRKAGGSCGQIDGFWASVTARCSAARVLVDSRHAVGSDHDHVRIGYQIELPKTRRKFQGGQTYFGSA